MRPLTFWAGTRAKQTYLEEHAGGGGVAPVVHLAAPVYPVHYSSRTKEATVASVTLAWLIMMVMIVMLMLMLTTFKMIMILEFMMIPAKAAIQEVIVKPRGAFLN